MVSVGTCAHLFSDPRESSYPPGGFVGAVWAVTPEHFAFVGALFPLRLCLSLALIAEEWSGKARNYTSMVMQRGKIGEAGVVMLQASREQLAERREARKEARQLGRGPTEASDWELGDGASELARRRASKSRSMEAEVAEERETILERAKSRGRKIADKRADKEEAQIARDSDKVIDDARLLLEPVRIQDNDAEFQLGDVETVQEPVEAAVVVVRPPQPLHLRSSLKPLSNQRFGRPVEHHLQKKLHAQWMARDLLLSIRDKRSMSARLKKRHGKRIVNVRKKRLKTSSYRLFRFFNMRVPTAKKSMRSNSNADKLVKTLKDYGIEGDIREIRPGPNRHDVRICHTWGKGLKDCWLGR